MGHGLRVFLSMRLFRLARWVSPPVTVTFANEERQFYDIGICSCCFRKVRASDENHVELGGVEQANAGTG